MNRRLAGFVLAVLFIVMAGMQYNDPDPMRWVAVYGAAAIASLLGAFGRLPVLVPAVIGAGALAWALLLVPDVMGKVAVGDLFETVEMQNKAVELGREMGGLLVVVAGMAVLLVLSLCRCAE